MQITDPHRRQRLWHLDEETVVELRVEHQPDFGRYVVQLGVYDVHKDQGFERRVSRETWRTVSVHSASALRAERMHALITRAAVEVGDGAHDITIATMVDERSSDGTD